MKNKDSKRQLKVGIFVLTGLILFIIGVFYIGRENNVFSKTFIVHSVFKNVEGLKPGDNVWLSGVKVGIVKQVKIIDNREVLVSLTLKEKQNDFISKDATAYVGSDGLVGNKIMVIRPGTANVAIDDNDTIQSYSPADTQEIMNMAKTVGDNVQVLTKDLHVLVSKLNEGQGLIGDLLNDGPLSQDIRSTVASSKNTAQSAVVTMSKINAMSNNLAKTIDDIQNGNGLVTSLIQDTVWTKTFENTLNNVAKVGEQTAKISNDLEQFSGNLNNKNTTIGKIMSDTTLANTIEETVVDAQSGVEKFDENMEALQHNFLLRGFFKKKKKREQKAQEALNEVAVKHQ